MERRARRLAAHLRDLRDVAMAFPDALVVLDEAGCVRWINREATRLLGLRWPRDRRVVLVERLRDTMLGDWLRGDEGSAEDIVSPIASDIHLHVGMIPFGRGRRVLLARDISHLARLGQVRRDFVANVSHELRTPLTVIHGYLELLDPQDVPALAPVLDEMRIQSRRMGQIVEDLLTLSRLEMQRHLHEERVPMAPMLAALRKEAQALSQGRHRVMLEDEAQCDLLGSTVDLHSAFSNLVSNAVRYTPTGGDIGIRWRRTAMGAEFSVVDSGYGIPAEHLSRLTERFYRVSSSRSRATGGTGLGLSIVKHVLNLHQAHLAIESEPGKGSTFLCRFEHARLLEAGSEVA
ncbi:MAG: phosphate regulon sensor histidine kinase PhoR [Proteobacteria bacterium]|nr:phosphate regulon sensor histidine kinase PhoR [Pseudomonadota bacterium]